ncbi:MAG: hypothetical protein K1W19_08495 [Lachnospiraceae bacterium]
MTENEAIKILQYTKRIRGLPEQGEKWEANRETIAIDMAVKALKEIEEYRKVGTVEEIKEILQIISEGQDDVDESGISTGLLHILLEYADYKKIGTVEECREVRERQRAKEIIHNPEGGVDEDWLCPTCGKFCSPYSKHCQHCGQSVKVGNAP